MRALWTQFRRVLNANASCHRLYPCALSPWETLRRSGFGVNEASVEVRMLSKSRTMAIRAAMAVAVIGRAAGRAALARIFHTLPAATPYSTARTGRSVRSPHHSVFTRFQRRTTSSTRPGSTLRRFATKECEICGLTAKRVPPQLPGARLEQREREALALLRTGS